MNCGSVCGNQDKHDDIFFQRNLQSSRGERQIVQRTTCTKNGWYGTPKRQEVIHPLTASKSVLGYSAPVNTLSYSNAISYTDVFTKVK